MREHIPDEDVGGEPPAEGPRDDNDRYGVIEIGNGDVVIYDRDEPAAWLQSNNTVSLEA
jgi:hypothetical protein